MVVAVSALALLVVSILTLTLGSLGVAIADLPSAVLGGAEGRDAVVLGTFRGPRLLVGIAVGGALGVAGALFQTVTRNPLGSPDVIGLSAGAGAGAVTAALLVPGIIPIPLGAVCGALLAVVLVSVGTGRGLSSPSRVILAGIGVSAMGYAIIDYALARAGREQATTVASFLSGSLSSRGWDDAALAWGTVALLLPLALLLAARLEVIALGDEVAHALGARPPQTRVLAILLAVGLCAMAVSVAGPIVFVSLVAPQIAARLTASPAPNLISSATTGALLLSVGDLAVQQAPFDVQLPVGVVTATLGGLYLGFLLVGHWKKATV